mgnify:CR=1 FL=1
MFDSEGNAQMRRHSPTSNSYWRRVAMYSTNTTTLATTQQYLSELGIPTRFFATKNSKGHLGALTVYGLEVRGSRTNYARFAEVIGSNIYRKHEVLQAIPLSYRPDVSQHARDAQRLGASGRRGRGSGGRCRSPRAASAARESLRYDSCCRCARPGLCRSSSRLPRSPQGATSLHSTPSSGVSVRRRSPMRGRMR